MKFASNKYIMKIRMKKWIFLLSLFFALNSCSTEGDSSGTVFVLPITEVIMPTEYALGEVSKIKIKYKRPTDCHIFNGFYTNYESSNLYDKIVAIQTVKLNNSTCNPDDEDNLFEVDLDFKPTNTGVYTFRFWLGQNVNGENQYETHEVEIL